MAETSCQYKAVENFVGTEIFMNPVEYREFASVQDSSDGVDDAAGKKPKKGCGIKLCHNVVKRENAKPAHNDVENGRYPFWTVDEKNTL